MLLEVEEEGTMRQRRLGPGADATASVRAIRHRMRAERPCVIFEVSSPELDDVVRLEDDYGREGTKAP